MLHRILWAGMVCYFIAAWTATTAEELSAQQSATPSLFWRKSDSCEDQYNLFSNGVCVGAYWFGTDEYWIYDSLRGVWISKAACPTPLPFDSRYGVKSNVLSKNPKYIINGKESTKEDVFKVIEQFDFGKDTNKFRVTVVSRKQDLEQIVNDIERSLASRNLKERVIVKGYEPTAWEVKEFRVSSLPAIYCQSPDGQVLHQQLDYNGGAVKAAEAISEAIAEYNPANAIDRRKNAIGSEVLTVALAILAVVSIFILGVMTNANKS